MDFIGGKPIYLQIMDSIKAMIIRGEFSRGEKMPSVRDIAIRFKVNPNTVQRSFSELEREGIINTQRGIGSFVTDDSSLIESIKMSLAGEHADKFINNMNSIGFSLTESCEFLMKRGKRNG